MIDFSFITALASIMLILIIFALLAQLPTVVWAITISLLLITGLIKNAK